VPAELFSKANLHRYFLLGSKRTAKLVYGQLIRCEQEAS
jgi:hypothetical protein